MSISYRYFCIIIFLLESINAVGQLDSTKARVKKNYLQLQFGFIQTRLIDFGYTDSKLLFRGTNSKFGLAYGRETNSTVFNFKATFGSGNLESKSGHLPTSFSFVEPSVEYLRKIKKYTMWRKQNIWFVGVRVSSINYYLQNEPIFDNIDLYSLHGAYVNLGNTLFFSEKKSLQISYSLPVAVYTNHILWNGGASTLNYNDTGHLLRLLTTRGRFSYMDIFKNIQLNVTYRIRISKNADAEFNYRFIYNSSQVMAPFHLFSNELLLGIKRRF